MIRPFQLEDEGKTWFISYLKKKGWTNIKDTDDDSIYAHCDLEAEYKGRKVIFEMKNRDFFSYNWGDTEFNLDKYEFLMNSPYDAAFVTFWMDKWCIIDVKRLPPTRIYEKMAQKSHRWNREKIMKKFVNWSIEDIKLLDYE